jgi:uncharacterized protein YggU (UPF0235/DUF167 family)
VPPHWSPPPAPARRVSIVRAQTSRDKVVRVEGITAHYVREVLTHSKR